MNEVLFLCTLLFTLSLSLVAFRLGKQFMLAYIATIGTMTAFLSPMIVTLFGFPFAMAEIFYATIFFSTDLVAEHWGKREAHIVVWTAVLVLITVGVLTQLAMLFVPHPMDMVAQHVRAIFGFSGRVLIAGSVMFFVEQHFDVWFFHYLKSLMGGKHLWLRNNLSTMTSQLIDVLGFYPLAFYGVYDNLLLLMVAGYIFKVSMALLDTPFMYLSYRIRSTARSF